MTPPPTHTHPAPQEKQENAAREHAGYKSKAFGRQLNMEQLAEANMCWGGSLPDNKNRIGRTTKTMHYEYLGESGRIPDLGSGGGVWGTIFIINCSKRIAQKLRRIILLHFGLFIFRFHLGEARKPFIFMIFDLVDVTMTPKPILHNFGTTK